MVVVSTTYALRCLLLHHVFLGGGQIPRATGWGRYWEGEREVVVDGLRAILMRTHLHSEWMMRSGRQRDVSIISSNSRCRECRSYHVLKCVTKQKQKKTYCPPPWRPPQSLAIESCVSWGEFHLTCESLQKMLKSPSTIYALPLVRKEMICALDNPLSWYQHSSRMRTAPPQKRSREIVLFSGSTSFVI